MAARSLSFMGLALPKSAKQSYQPVRNRATGHIRRPKRLLRIEQESRVLAPLFDPDRKWALRTPLTATARGPSRTDDGRGGNHNPARNLHMIEALGQRHF